MKLLQKHKLPLQLFVVLLTSLSMLSADAWDGKLNENKQSGGKRTSSGHPKQWLTKAAKGWMEQLPNDTKLKDVSMPGTHNSAALYSNPASGTRSTANQAVCQKWSIAEQLKAGIRYFDIRVCKKGNKFRTHHNQVPQKASLGNVLSDIDSFLKKHRGEFVIMHLKNAGGCPGKHSKSAQRDLWKKKYKNKYSFFYTPNGKSITDVKVSELRGKVVLLRAWPAIEKEASTYGWKLNDRNIRHKSQKVRTVFNVEQKKKTVKQALRKAKTSSKLCITKLSGAYGGIAPYTLAHHINTTAYKFFGSNKKGKTGIVVMDYPGDKLIYRILKRNFAK